MLVRRFALSLSIVMLLLLSVVPAFAQNTTRTRTVTEAQVNSAYRITNPVRRQITNKRVDLQPGQVVITATVTGNNFGPYDVSVTVVPSISNGRVNWTVTAATANGQAATGDILTIINNNIVSSWWRYVRSQTSGRVTDLVITDTDATLTFTTR